MEGFLTILEEKKQIGDKLVKRNEDKEQYFMRISKRKLPMKEQEEEAGSREKKRATVD